MAIMNMENVPSTMKRMGRDVDTVSIRIPAMIVDHPDFPFEIPSDILLTFKGKEIIIRPYIKRKKKEESEKEDEGENDGEKNEPDKAEEN